MKRRSMKGNGGRGVERIRIKPNEITKHHMLPKRRGGGNGSNIIFLAHWFHRAYHKLFGNLTPEEAIYLLAEVFDLEVVIKKKRGIRKKIKWSTSRLSACAVDLQTRKH